MNYIRDPIYGPILGEVAKYGYQKYIRPKLEKAWEYKLHTAPLLLSSKINKMPPTPKKTPQKTPQKRGRSESVGSTRSAKRSRSRSMVSFASSSGTTGSRGGAGSYKKVGKLKKVKKVLKKDKVTKLSAYGFNSTTEVSKVVSGPDCVVVGHSTFAALALYRGALISMFKKFFNQRSIDLIDVTEPIKGITTGTTLTVTYRAQGFGLATQVYTSGTSTSLLDLTNWWMATTRPWYDQPNTVFVKVEISDSLMQLVNTKFNFAVRSTLKMQNRTTDSGGDQASDQIDVVPLTGKSYGGKGNQLLSRKSYQNNTTNFVDITGDRWWGTIIGSTGSEPSLSEPPQPTQFSNCKKIGAVNISPGEISESVLSDNFTLSFNKLHYYCTALSLAPNLPPTVPPINLTPRMIPLGQFRAFFIEKLLNIAPASLTSNDEIKLAFEQNLEFSVTCQHKYHWGLVKMFERVPAA